MMSANVLVVDDEPDICSLVKEILQDEGLNVQVANNGEQAKSLKEQIEPDLILLDIWMPDIDGISVLKEWKNNDTLTAPVVMMSGHGTVETAVEATRLGAYDFIEKPLSLAKLLLTVKHALEHSSLNKENKRLTKISQFQTAPIGKSQMMDNLRNQIKRIANHNTPVLISGENGTDKELYARYIHNESERSHQPLMAISFSALTADVADKELFGYQDGQKVVSGLFEKTNGGSLYLKDITDMPANIQGKLQAALETKHINRNGSAELIPVDVRIIAATREELEIKVQSGDFRDDLFYQLSVVPIEIPPLRDHPEDIPELLEYYANVFVERENLSYRRFSVAAQNRLRSYTWPGNVRELRNLVQRLLILGTHEVIELNELDTSLGKNSEKAVELDGINLDLPIREAREQFEREYFEYQLQKNGGSVSKVAQIAGMERTHLYRKLKSLDIDIKN